MGLHGRNLAGHGKSARVMPREEPAKEKCVCHSRGGKRALPGIHSHVRGRRVESACNAPLN